VAVTENVAAAGAVTLWLIGCAVIIGALEDMPPMPPPPPPP